MDEIYEWDLGTAEGDGDGAGLRAYGGLELVHAEAYIFSILVRRSMGVQSKRLLFCIVREVVKGIGDAGGHRQDVLVGTEECVFLTYYRCN